MDIFLITFETAGIQTWIFIPPMVAFTISFFTSMAGISGAFLLLPFQVSILGFTGPSVSATNLLYNIVGTPGGVGRYVKSGRMLWPLAACILLGAIPGVAIGYFLRVTLMPDPSTFKLFVGFVLLFIAWRLYLNLGRPPEIKKPDMCDFQVRQISFTLRKVQFKFNGDDIRFCGFTVLLVCLLVGTVSGIYGIGGGAIIAPFLVTTLHLPVYTVAGAVLAANFMTSLVGMAFYSTIPLANGAASPPDFILGLLFGIGGLSGMYMGAKCQNRLPVFAIKLILLAVILMVSVKYILQYF